MNKNILAHEFFRGMTREHLAVLAEGAREESYKAGDLVLREGEPANKFHLIQSGKIALEAHEAAGSTVSLQTLGAGDVMGWSWLFPPFVWHLQARALEPVKTIALSGAHLLTTAEGDREFGYELMKRVAHVVIQRLQVARKQLIELQHTKHQ